MPTIGEKIAELRRKNGMTQEELASLLGISAQSVSKWETGATPMPDILLLPILADVFGVRIDALFGKNAQAVVCVSADRCIGRGMRQPEANSYGSSRQEG